MSKRFLISEEDRKSILSLYAKKGIIHEQDVNNIETINSGNATNDWQVGENLEKDVNKIIQSVQNEIFRQITLQFVSGPNNEKTDPFVFSVLKNRKDTGQKITLKYEYIEDKENFQAYSVYRSFYKSISFGKTSIVEYLRPIFKNRDYITLFEKYPSVEEYVKNLTVDFGIEPYKSGDIAIGGVIRKGDGDYKLRRPIPFGDKITSIGSGVTIFKLKLNRKSYFSLELANAEMKLAEIKVPNPVEKPKIPEEIAFDFVIETENNFEYDSATLTQEAERAIDNKINEKFNSIEPKYQQGYLNFIENKVIPVYAYASIDDDSNAKDGGNFTGNGADGQSCSVYGKGKGPRYKYNQCLSEARAQSVVNYLKTANNKMFENINFSPVGKGETCEFSKKCWTLKNPVKNPDSTYKDRRFSVNFPKWTANY